MTVPDAVAATSAATASPSVRTAPAGPTPPPALAPGVELLGETSGSGYAQARSLVRRPDGQTLQLTELLYALLCELDGARGPEQLALALGERIDRAVAPDDVRHLLAKLEPLGVLASSAPAGAAKANPLLALRFKVVVSDPAATRRITAPLAWLFHAPVVVPVLVAFLATCWFVLVEQGLAQATRQAFTEPGVLLGVFALVVVSAGIHELGHAAACRYAGATPGAMGAGLYLVWPAFYTDVDDAYRLPRRGRLVVDLGGLYFNCVVAVAVMAAWLVTGVEALLLGVAAQLLQMLRQLAPFVRADGYHILSDLTGVPDLFGHLKPTLVGMLPWHWGEPSPLRRRARVIVTAWVLVVTPLLLAAFLSAVLLLPRLAATAWDGVSRQTEQLGPALESADVLGVLANGLSVLALVLPVAATCYLLVSVVRRLVRWAARTTEDRPVRRTAAALTGAAVVALFAWAWWPAGQYEPVRADERGTIVDALQVRPASASQPVVVAAPPRTALALVPRDDAAAPVLLVLQDEDGAPVQTLLTSRPETPGEAVQARVVPFELPEAPGEGDNQAVAVNTTDGTVVYDVAVALVTITDGASVTSTNEAVALASCEGCATVSVAFQVVLVVGQSDVQVPVNTAEALNRDCVRCLTAALAKQLVVSLSALPDEQVQQQLADAMSRLDGLEQLARDLDIDAVLAQLASVEREVLTILRDAGLVELPTTTSPSPATGASTSATPSPGSTPSPVSVPGATPTEGVTDPLPTVSPTPLVEPSPSAGQSTPAGDGTATAPVTATTSSPPAQPAPTVEPVAATSPDQLPTPTG